MTNDGVLYHIAGYGQIGWGKFVNEDLFPLPSTNLPAVWAIIPG